MFVIQNAAREPMHCSISVEGEDVAIVADADGVASLANGHAAQILVIICGWAWVSVPAGYMLADNVLVALPDAPQEPADDKAASKKGGKNAK